MLNVDLVWATALLYLLLLFLVAYWADRRQLQKKDVTANAAIYSLSIAVYANSWFYCGSVGTAGTTGISTLHLSLGPGLTALSLWFLLRDVIRTSPYNNLTAVTALRNASFDKRPWLGVLVTVVCL